MNMPSPIRANPVHVRIETRLLGDSVLHGGVHASRRRSAAARRPQGAPPTNEEPSGLSTVPRTTGGARPRSGRWSRRCPVPSPCCPWRPPPLPMNCCRPTRSRRRGSSSSRRFPRFERMAPVFTTAGIRTRQLVRPIEWYLTPKGWPERTEAYLEGALDLFVGAANRGPGRGRAAWPRRRRGRHGLVHRHRHAQPRGAGDGAARFSARRRARPGVRPRLRRRGDRPGSRREAGARHALARLSCWSPSNSAALPFAWTI